MNLIATLLRRDPVVAERAVPDLSELRRAALGAGEVASTLSEDVSLAERYLSIEQLRLGDRLRVAGRRQGDPPWTCLAMEAGVLESVANPLLPPDNAPAQGAGDARRSIAHRLGSAFGPRARRRYGWNDGRYACTIRGPVPTDGAEPVPGGRTP